MFLLSKRFCKIQWQILGVCVVLISGCGGGDSQDLPDCGMNDWNPPIGSCKLPDQEDLPFPTQTQTGQ